MVTVTIKECDDRIGSGFLFRSAFHERCYNMSMTLVRGFSDVLLIHQSKQASTLNSTKSQTQEKHDKLNTNAHRSAN